MNQRNKREKAKGHVLQWFVVVVELRKHSSKDPQQFCHNEWSAGKQVRCQSGECSEAGYAEGLAHRHSLTLLSSG